MNTRFRTMTDETVVFRFTHGQKIKEIALAAGITDRAIRNILTKHLGKIGRRHTKKYTVNEAFFMNWTCEMAWVLGMFITDGNISKSKNTFSFAQKDEKILKTIAECMSADYEIKKKPTTSILEMNSAELVKQLNSLGIYPNKSLTIKFPKVPKQYLPSFIRGVIDGDGWVQASGYVMNVTTGSKDFAYALKKVFDDWGLRCEIKEEISKAKAKNIIYRVWVKGNESLNKLAEIIYEHCSENNFIPYKRERMEQRKASQLT